jgi:hypothetical protein
MPLGEQNVKRPQVSRRIKPRPAHNTDEAALAQHRARCRVCRHAQREEIERQFLEWENPREIAAQYKFPSYRSIYRHARAMGLFRKRLGHIELALDRIIERVGGVNITAASVIAAARLRMEIEKSHYDIHLQALRGELPAKYYALAAAAAAKAGETEDEAHGEENDENERHTPAGFPSEMPTSPDGPAAQTETPPEIIPEPEPEPEAASDIKSPESQISEVGIRREPDGPPILAGKTLPWPPGKIQFARRPRWRPIGQG